MRPFRNFSSKSRQGRGTIIAGHNHKHEGGIGIGKLGGAKAPNEVFRETGLYWEAEKIKAGNRFSVQIP